MKLTLMCSLMGLIGSLGVAALITSTATECLAAGCQQEKNGATRRENQPIACSLTAMTAEQRKRHAQLREQMQKGVQEVKELPDGYAFRFASDAKTIVNLAEFVSLERLCCPFFRFELTMESGASPVWLKLSGGEGVKEFLKAEFSRK